jgi:hypothetical protein
VWCKSISCCLNLSSKWSIQVSSPMTTCSCRSKSFLF